MPPRAGRLSRLGPAAPPEPAIADHRLPAAAPIEPVPPAQPPAPIRHDDPPAPPTPPAQPPVPPAQPPVPIRQDHPPAPPTEPAPPPASAVVARGSPTTGVTELKQLQPSAARAKTAQKPNSSTGPAVFKPLEDNLANRSVLVSGLGLVLCFIPVLSVLGLAWGLISARRISRSEGTLLGIKTARLGIVLGAAGLVMGITVDVIFLLRGS